MFLPYLARYFEIGVKYKYDCDRKFWNRITHKKFKMVKEIKK